MAGRKMAGDDDSGTQQLQEGTPQRSGEGGPNAPGRLVASKTVPIAAAIVLGAALFLGGSLFVGRMLQQPQVQPQAQQVSPEVSISEKTAAYESNEHTLGLQLQHDAGTAVAVHYGSTELTPESIENGESFRGAYDIHTVPEHTKERFTITYIRDGAVRTRSFQLIPQTAAGCAVTGETKE